MIKWTLEDREIGEIYENPFNPRSLSEETSDNLETSLSKFGLCQPISIQPDGLIIGGHQRYRLIKKMGMDRVAVYIPERPLSDEEYRELSIRLNKNVGDWDFELLSSISSAEELLEFGFTSSELGLGVEKENPPPSHSLTIKFGSAEDLEKAYEEIEKIIDKFLGASCAKKPNKRRKSKK